MQQQQATSSGVALDSTSSGVLAPGRSFWRDAARSFARNKAGVVGLVVVLLMIVAAALAPWLAPYDYLKQDYTALLKSPSAKHIMGTDELGRDIFSRVLMGARTALLVATLITAISTAIGVFVGAVGALRGGWVDALLVWLMDALLSFPPLFLAAFLSVTTRPSVTRFATGIYERTGWTAFQDPVLFDYLVVVLATGFITWPYVGRLVRGQVLSLREKEFIEAERAMGASLWWITTKHLIPNVLGAVIVAMTISFGSAMLYEASLSFLGIGIRPPGASWGRMIFEGVPRWRSNAYLVLMPGITLSIIVLALNFMGDALNDALNPQARGR